MQKPIFFVTSIVFLVSEVLAHDDEVFSVSEAVEESKLAYLVLGMAVLIALTSIYFITRILIDEKRSLNQ